MNKILNRIVWLIVLIPGIYLTIIWNKLPTTIPLHFDINGDADRYGNKNELIAAIAILSVVSILVYLLLKNIYRIDPKKYAAENKDRLLRIGFAVTVFLTTINCMVIYSGISGSSGFNIGFVLSAVGLFFAIIGNYLPNLKPNYFAGFRLPWTLENADNWKKTHALAGKLWFAGGIGLAIICVFIPPNIAIIIFFTVMTVITIIPCIYSYRLFKESQIKN